VFSGKIGGANVYIVKWCLGKMRDVMRDVLFTSTFGDESSEIKRSSDLFPLADLRVRVRRPTTPTVIHFTEAASHNS
jgi:hypothetical protein